MNAIHSIPEIGRGSLASPLILILAALVLTVTAVANSQDVEVGDNKIIARSSLSTDPEMIRLRILQKHISQHPDDLRTAITVARKFVQKGKKQNDNRFLGYAESVLARWLTMENIPTDVLLLNAEIKEYRHEFTAALADLETVNDASPHDPTARLMRSNIYQIQGYFEAAQTQCRALGPRAIAMSTICGLSLTSLTGDLEESYQALSKFVAAQRMPPEIETWALGKLADMSIRSGRLMDALTYFEQMPRNYSQTSALRSQLLDLLLMLEKPSSVLTLVAADEKSDGLIIRRLRAMKMLGMDWRGTQAERLERYFDSLERQPVNPHAREVAYYHLYLTEDFDRAFAAALKNWDQQKEPIDTLLVLAAAHNAGKISEVDAVNKWIVKNRYQDETIASYLLPNQNQVRN